MDVDRLIERRRAPGRVGAPRPATAGSRGFAAAALLVCSPLAACVAPMVAERPRVVQVPVRDAQPVAHLRDIQSSDVALATIAAVFERDFDFPRIDAEVVFLPDRAALEQALLSVGYDSRFAHDTAARMRAVALRRRVLINSRLFSSKTWMSRVGTLAHELVHCLQYELAGGRRGTSEQWLREGFAEWIALDVLQRIGGVSPALVRQRLETELAASRREVAPRLDDMMTFRQWVELAAVPDVVPHVQSVLLVDLLMETHGVPAFLDYFRSFAVRQDPEMNFRAAFGQTRAEFERTSDWQLGLRR